MTNHWIGIQGEEAAAKYYRARGYQILAANYRTRQGEIDLIAGKGGLQVFVEVKTRRPDSMVSGAEAVTAAKQRRLIAAAGSWLSIQQPAPEQLRFDVVTVLCDKGKILNVQCIENAFGV